jgi:hypothetical protein
MSKSKHNKKEILSGTTVSTAHLFKPFLKSTLVRLASYQPALWERRWLGWEGMKRKRK